MLSMYYLSILAYHILQVEALLSKYEWIATDRQYFGKANTAYDFGSNNPETVSKRLAKLEEQKVN